MPNDQNPTNPNIGDATGTPGSNSPVSGDPQVQNTQPLPSVGNTPGPDSSQDLTSENNQTTTPAPADPNNPIQDPQAEVIVSPHVPKKYGGSKVIATIFGIIVLVGGITAGVILVQRQQQIAERAASGSECQQAPDCILLENPGNSDSFSSPQEIVEVAITAKDVFTFQPGLTEDGCYRVKIEGRELAWQRYGGGPDCKDVSNVQIRFQGSTEFMRICHYTSNLSEHPWQAIEISVASWPIHKSHGDFLWEGPEEIWPPDPGLSDPTGITDADLWCEDNAPPTITPGVTDTPKIIAECSSVKAYDTNWNLLSQTELSNLESGIHVRFTVSGTASSGSFDKARFSLNSTDLGETTLKKPGSDEFYIEYTVATNVTSFTVGAQVHHSELGWF